MTEFFIAIDGDDVGHYLEHLIVSENIKLLEDFFKKFQYSMKWLEEFLCEKYNATIIFNGGDNLLAKASPSEFFSENIELFRQDFFKLSGKTLSVGVGKTPKQCFLALKLAKAKGKNCTVYFDEVINV